MRRTAEILKFKELKTMDDVREAFKALQSDSKKRRVTSGEFVQISQDLSALLTTISTAGTKGLNDTLAKANEALASWQKVMNEGSNK